MDVKLQLALCLLGVTSLLGAVQCDRDKDGENEIMVDGTSYYNIISDVDTPNISRSSLAGYNYGTNDNGNSKNTSEVINEPISNTVKSYLSSRWLTTFIPLVYTLVFAVALPLNVVAIIIFLLKTKVRKPGVIYLLNLAAADVLFVILLPFHIAYRFSGNNWLIGDGLCRLYTAASYCNMYCSILLMTSIGVDRFLAVVYPMRSLSWRTTGRAWLACCFIWIVSIAGTVPLITGRQTQRIAPLNVTTCYDVLSYEDHLHYYIYYFTTFIFAFFFFPLIVTVVCYAGTIRTLSASTPESRSKRSRALVLTVAVLFVFVFCFGPTNIIFIIHYLNIHQQSSESLFFAYIMCACISSVSCCLDPVIYYYASKAWQRHMYSLLHCNKNGGSQVKY
ncbi:proteinase-activated receptor 1-like isoform X2 [Pseudophryne corroboree]|uniref:proteinase-activated receptor 1-like isoform X2 n=1 Tax=Pseudophryne corroboree TaxID=495146 RepID=UPI00308124A9